MTQRRIYQDEYPYFVTFRTREELQLFEKTKHAELLADITFSAGRLKRFDILVYQIMLDHVHLLVQYRLADRTLESMRSVFVNHNNISSECTLSRVRSDKKEKYTISDFMQSIKGNFSRELRMGNIWQCRFYARIVNDQKYLETVIHYIKNNPTKEKLPQKYYQPP